MFRVSVVLILGSLTALGCAQPLAPDPLPDAMMPVPQPSPVAGLSAVEGTGGRPCCDCSLGPRGYMIVPPPDDVPTPADSWTVE